MPRTPLVPDLLQALLAPPSRPKQPSPTARASAARMAALRALREWGHLRCSELGRLLWPEARHGEQMAQRLTRRLEERGEVVRRLNALGGSSFVLSRCGAAALEVMGLSAHHGLELSSVGGATFVHRTLAANFGISKALEGFTVYGEHAIAQGQGPCKRDQLSRRYSKQPDLLLLRRGVATWVEVEAAAKPMRELISCTRIAEHAGQLLMPGAGASVILGRLVFVFDASQGHAQRIRRAVRTAWSDKSPREREILRARIALVGATIGTGMRWLDYREEPC